MNTREVTRQYRLSQWAPIIKVLSGELVGEGELFTY